MFKAGALGEFDPVAMVSAACGFLMREGPTTAQERWEENSGFSPSTLAINIAALVCAGDLLEAGGDTATAEFVREYADFLEQHVDAHLQSIGFAKRVVEHRHPLRRQI